jgi:hypothetical protein
MEITLNHVDVSMDGDYYQVHFSANKDRGNIEIVDYPYFLIQRQFEMPDDGKVYIESHDDNYIGHHQVNRASIERSKIHIELKKKKHSNVVISFKTDEKKYKDLCTALSSMISNVTIKGKMK